jgi:hypothetical protein
MVGVPVQVPLPAVSVLPSEAVPEIVGGEVLTGGVGSTSPLAELEALAVPPAFVAVSTTFIVEPTSAGVSA